MHGWWLRLADSLENVNREDFWPPNPTIVTVAKYEDTRAEGHI